MSFRRASKAAAEQEAAYRNQRAGKAFSYEAKLYPDCDLPKSEWSWGVGETITEHDGFSRFNGFVWTLETQPR